MACMTVPATGARNHTYPLWQGNNAVLMGAKRTNCTGWRLGAVDDLRRSASMFTVSPILISAWTTVLTTHEEYKVSRTTLPTSFSLSSTAVPMTLNSFPRVHSRSYPLVH